MCHRRPGVYLQSLNELELEEFLWAIHERVDSIIEEITYLKGKYPKWKVITNPYIMSHSLLGYKTPQYMKPGIVYAPYIPIQRTDIIINGDFSPVKGIKRYTDKAKNKMKQFLNRMRKK